MSGKPKGPSVIRDCTHPNTFHPHGSNLAFVRDKCRCLECRRAAAVYQSQRARRRAYGRPDPLVPALGSIRRLQALQTMGWAVHRLEKMEAAEGVLPPIRLQPNSRGQWVTRAKAERIARLYDALWDKPAPARTTGERKSVSHALHHARANGYLPPLAWDDDCIDSPTAMPAPVDDVDGLDEIAVERLMAGTLALPPLTRSPERIEAVKRLHQAGYSHSEIGARIGVSNDGVLKLLNRHVRKVAA